MRSASAVVGDADEVLGGLEAADELAHLVLDAGVGELRLHPLDRLVGLP